MVVVYLHVLTQSSLENHEIPPSKTDIPHKTAPVLILRNTFLPRRLDIILPYFILLLGQDEKTR